MNVSPQVGLDYSPWIVSDSNDKQVQLEAFVRQIELANKYNLPLVRRLPSFVIAVTVFLTECMSRTQNVHSRNASPHAVNALIENKAKGALLHAYDGGVKVAMKAVRAGLMFSVPPNIIRFPDMQKYATSLVIVAQDDLGT